MSSNRVKVFFGQEVTCMNYIPVKISQTKVCDTIPESRNSGARCPFPGNASVTTFPYKTIKKNVENVLFFLRSM
jgi:hypothetical protein